MTDRVVWNGHTILCFSPYEIWSERKEPWHLVPFAWEIPWKEAKGGTFSALCGTAIAAARCWSSEATMGQSRPPVGGICIDCLWRFIETYLE